MDSLDDYLLEYILLSINDFRAYFIAQLVSVRFKRILKSCEEAKLIQFSTTETIVFGVRQAVVNVLPNGKYHGRCETAFVKKGFWHLSCVNYSRGHKHGLETRHLYGNPNTNRAEINWDNGVKCGTQIQYFRSIQKCTPYVCGVKNGLQISTRSDDGRECVHVPYVNGKVHGAVLNWYTNGQLESKIAYADGKIHPLFETWYSNGQRALTKHYWNGIQHGSTTSWHENGQLYHHLFFLFGVRHGIEKYWNIDGQIFNRIPWFKDQIHGIQKLYHYVDRRKSCATWINGVRQSI